MPHPLQTRIHSLRARLWGWIALYGLGCWLACGIGAVVVAALTDYLVRFRDPGIRVLATLGVAAVLGWSAYRYVYRPWTVSWRDVDLARRVQMRFPALGDDLASAMEFLGQADDDPTAGSLALRRAIVARAADASAGLDFRQVLRPGPAWLAGLAAVGAALAAGLMASADPTSAQIAVARLTEPLADIPWPQVHHLAVQNPIQRLARGQAFELEVVDSQGAHFPSEVRVHYRFRNSDGSEDVESEPMRLVKGMMVARRERVTRPFSFRVEGGDDRAMPWHPVEVVDPPAIASLRVTLTPPEYTGWRPERSEGNIRALAGTRAEIAATATKPLVSAILVANGQASESRLSSDGRQLIVPAESGPEWILDKSGSYGFRLTDRDRITTDGEDARWEIRVVPDAPPTVSLDEPRPGENLFVAPQAVVPLAITAGDDLAIQRVELQFTRSDRPGTAPVKQSLDAGPAQAKPARQSAAASEKTRGQGERRSIRYAWQLGELKLPPGTQVTFWIEAADYKPQSAKSEPRRLAVVTPEELSQRLASREAAVLAELTRALQLQRQGRQQIATLEKRAAQPPRLGQLDVDQLRAVELNQRQIEQMLASRADGIPQQVLGLLADLANNKLDQPRVRQRMETLLQRLERLASGELAAASRELTAAIKAAQASLDQPDAWPATPAQAPLAATGKHQDAIIAALEQMVEDLSQWDRFRSFLREMSQLAREQDELSGRTRDLARRTLTKRQSDLTPQETAGLADAARQQAALAARLDGIQHAMHEAIKQAAAGEPAAASATEGLRRARELNLAGDMRSAGEQIQDNRLGQATQQQARIEEGLQDVLDRLSGRGPRDPNGQSNSPRKSPVADLRKMQIEINRRTEELEKAFQRADKSSPEARGRYEAVGSQQEQLGELVRRIFGSKAEAAPGESKVADPRPIAATKPTPSARPLDPQGADAIDRELFAPDPKHSPPPAVPAETKGPVTPAVVRDAMLHAARRIRQTDAGTSTQQLQRHIVAQLEELLRQPGQEPDRAPSPSGQQARQQEKPGGQQPSDPKTQHTATRPGSQPGQNPESKKTGDGEPSGPGVKMSLVRRVWGNLPERQRAEILQLQPPEEFLPQYETQIESYFRQLAEGGTQSEESRGQGAEGGGRSAEGSGPK